MRERERPETKVGRRVRNRAKGELNRVDHRVDSNRHNVELISFTAMPVATMLSRDSEQDFVRV